jgi:hypothetical protein
MAISELQYFVTYYPDYPGSNGDEHVFFLNAKDSTDFVVYSNLYLESHRATSCLIDHEARLADINIPEEAKLRILQAVWLSSKY